MSLSSKLPSTIYSVTLGLELGKLYLSSANCLPIRLHLSEVLDEDQKTRKGRDLLLFLSVPPQEQPFIWAPTGQFWSCFQLPGSFYSSRTWLTEASPSWAGLLSRGLSPSSRGSSSKLFGYQPQSDRVLSSEVCHPWGNPIQASRFYKP